MAIDKKLIHFKQWSTFISESGVNGNYTTPSSGTAGSGSALYGQIKETSIVFIQDVQRIWTHGKLYECSAPDLSKYLTAEDLSDLNSFVEKCSVTKTGNGNGETLTVTVGDSSNSITNTWRTVQVNGSSIGDNVLNLKAGTNITLSKSNGEVTVTGASFPTSLPANGGTADKANTLTNAKTIDGVDFDGSANITHYGTCGTAAGTAAKTVSLTGYKLATGAKVAVKFTVTNTAANPTLNVNSTGAKAIYYRGAAISKGYLAANRVYEFVYDGTHYELIGDINTDTDNNTAHSHSVGTGLSASGSGGTSGTTTYSLKTAATDEIGGIKVASVGTAASGANTTVNANKFAVHVDSNGLGYVAIPQYSNNSGDITGVTAGSGLTGGATSGNATVSHADTSTLEGSYGQESDVTQSAKNTASFVVPQITVDGFGHVTGIANKTITVTDTNTTYSSLKNPTSLTLKYNDTQSFTYDGSAAKTLNIKPGSNVSVSGDSSGNITIAATDTKYSAGSGLTLSGTTFNHSNSVEGSAICNSTATSGKTITIPHFTFDDQGHITAAGTRTHTVSGFTNNSGTVTSITPGTGLTGTSSDAAITTSGTINLKPATTSEIGGIKVAKDNASYAVATNTSPDITADVTTAGKYYGVEIDKNDKAYVYVPWTDNNTTSFTITATATDDDVVVLTGTNGTNKTTYDAKHAKTFGNTTAPYTAKYTSGNTTTSISGSGASSTIKIPQITVDEYGHVRAAADESITITMPTIPTIPSLSGGAAAESGKYVSGVTVSGHTVTVAKGTLPTIPTALKNPNALTFGSKTYDGSEAKTITAADLGLGTALKFHGTSKTAITDGSTTQTVTLSNNSSHTAENGCVLFYGNKEFVWNGSSWEELGNEGNYKVKQTAVSSPTASGNTTAFIDTISQNENGVISATKKYITNNVTYTGTLVDEQVAVFEGTSGQVKASGYTIASSVPSNAKFTDTNTHYTSKNIVGASSTATANAVASNGSVWLNHLEESTVKSSHNIVGAGSVTVASDANGKITITGTDTNTDTKVTSVGNHYTPSANSSAELTAAISGTAGAYAKDTEYTVLTGVKAQRDAKGHVVGLTYTAQKIKDTNTDTNTHWTTRLYAGASGTAANAAASNPYLKVTDDNTYRNQVQFAGAGTVSVASDAAGKITITGSAHPTSLPASDVYPWAKAKNKPTYTATEVGALPITGGAIGEGNANNFPITISSTAAYTGIAFTTSGGTGYMRYLGGSDWGVTNNGWTASYTLLHSGNYNSYAPKLDGTGASGTWGIDITGSAVQLTAQTLFPNREGIAQKWRRFAKLELKYQYKGSCANFQLRVNTSTQQSGDSCEVYAMMYQQAALGQAPVYTIKTNCSDTRLKIIGVLNYSTSGDTLELYAYCPYSYYSVSVSSLYDPDNTLSIGTSYVASLPSGTQITPIQMGTSYSANKLTTARTIWGQSFDGTGNISGTLSSVNNIYPNSSAEKYIGKSDNPFKYVYAEWFGAGTGKSLSFGANNGTHIWVTTSGNVGINNSNPASKLHVTGGITASDNITTSGLVKIKDASIMYDSTQKCIKFTF